MPIAIIAASQMHNKIVLPCLGLIPKPKAVIIWFPNTRQPKFIDIATKCSIGLKRREEVEFGPRSELKQSIIIFNREFSIRSQPRVELTRLIAGQRQLEFHLTMRSHSRLTRFECLLYLNPRLATTVSDIEINWVIVHEAIFEEGEVAVIVGAPLLGGLEELTHAGYN